MHVHDSNNEYDQFEIIMNEDFISEISIKKTINLGL